MLDIIAITYKNIGPFKGNPISIFFQQGKYLIKAPIGTGKSFLFFDGPIYGLYKYNTRSLLNNTSSEGYIKMLFSYENETRLIVRNISKAKIKESCSSILYKVDNQRYDQEEIMQRNQDIENILRSSGANLERTEFKNETDLQQTFLSFLPPKEVFVNTVFLMQDSDNIFELLPSERLTVLKNVFGLLGIDEAKEIISEKKKEITYKLKSQSDNSKFDEKIKILIKKLLQNHSQLKAESILEISDLLEEKTKTLSEIELIQEKITIQDLNIDNFGSGLNGDIDIIIQGLKDVYKRSQNQLDNTYISIKNTKNKIDNKRQELFSMNKINQELANNIKTIESNDFDKIKNALEELNKRLNEIDNNIDKQKIDNFQNSARSNDGLKEYSDLEVNGIESLYNMINHLIEKGRSIQEKIKNDELNIKNIELQKKSEEDKQIQTEKSLIEQLNSLEKQLSEIQYNINSFENSINQQATFSCEKIRDNCPFIKIINKKTFDQLEEQKQKFLNNEKILINNIESKKSEISKQKINNIDSNLNKEKISELQNSISQKELSINIIKSFLNEINWKSIEEQNQDYTNINKERKIKEQQLKSAEEQQKKKEEYIQQLEKNKDIQKLVEKEIDEQENELKILETQKKDIENQIQNSDYKKILKAEELNNECINIQRDISNTINDFKKIQIELEILKKQEKQINNLYTIFSKELLLLVLQDHLPILNDIINNYLSQIVDYQVSLKLNKTNSEKLELEANIIDQQGEREIKSLSGGQKIILKLIWMLSISAYMRSPLLFLDETINNLDSETVSKVADMLEDFVKQRNIKFYTVTHNQQIQDMQIRDKTIEITR